MAAWLAGVLHVYAFACACACVHICMAGRGLMGGRAHVVRDAYARVARSLVHGPLRAQASGSVPLGGDDQPWGARHRWATPTPRDHCQGPLPGTIARDHCQGRTHWEGTPPLEAPKAPKAKRPAVFAVFHVVVPQLPLRGTLFLLPRERHLRTPTCARRWGGGTVSSVSHSAVRHKVTRHRHSVQCTVCLHAHL